MPLSVVTWIPELSIQARIGRTAVAHHAPRSRAGNPAFGALKGVRCRAGKSGNFVRDRETAILLGKALFWDVQVGSDRQACASCLFTRVCNRACAETGCRTRITYFNLSAHERGARLSTCVVCVVDRGSGPARCAGRAHEA
jgi:hypothetical protein